MTDQLSENVVEHVLDVHRLTGASSVDSPEDHRRGAHVVIEIRRRRWSIVQPVQELGHDPAVPLARRWWRRDLLGDHAPAPGVAGAAHHLVEPDADRAVLAFGAVVLLVPGILLTRRRGVALIRGARPV